jgi:peptidoglycan/LPS O-acetylase OafA/YrhL
LTSAHSVLEPTLDRHRSGWDVLSVLRFFLAFIVALTHLKAYAPLGPLAWIEKLGFFEAILGFLLISGYSIGHSIQKQPEGFLRRRMLRIYPVYLVAMAMTYAVGQQAWTGAFAWHFFANLFFLGQLADRHSYIVPAWSLHLEVWLYCLAPLFLLLRARRIEWLIGSSLACYVLYTCGRTLFHWPYFAGTIGGVNLPTLAFIWLAGFYLATSSPEKARPLKIVGLLFAVHLVLSVGIQLLFRLKHRGLDLFFSADLAGFLGNALLLLLIFIVFRGVIFYGFHLTLFQRRICRLLGDISYPLYLVHFVTFSFLARYFPQAGLLLLAALLLATVVYFCCDFYSRRRKLV